MLLIIISLSLFTYGVVVGHYEVFPYDVLKNSKFFITPSENNPEIILYSIPDVNSLIRINSDVDISKKRSDLIDYIWKVDGFPSSNIPTKTDFNVNDERIIQFVNLKTVEKLVVKMDYGIDSIIYIFVPEQSNGKAVLYHEGHAGDFFNGQNTIQFFLNNGFLVAAFSMPLTGMNSQPIIEDDDFGYLKLSSHGDFQFLESETLSPIKFFLEPIAITLNHLDTNYNFEKYYMVGISGGGWTAILYPAIDDRISESYSVAGSVPMFLRTIPKNHGDYEQQLPELYRIANYLELYVMASYGDDRQLVQIFNKYDSCCFPGEPFVHYEKEVKNKLTTLGEGNFFTILDDSHKGHMISDFALTEILLSMQK